MNCRTKIGFIFDNYIRLYGTAFAIKTQQLVIKGSLVGCRRISYYTPFIETALIHAVLYYAEVLE